MKYVVVVPDENGKSAWMRQYVWTEFWQEPAQEVVSDSKVLFRGNDDYLFVVVQSVADNVFESMVAHSRCQRQLAFHKTNRAWRHSEKLPVVQRA
jgi:hypothetical protein